MAAAPLTFTCFCSQGLFLYSAYASWINQTRRAISEQRPWMPGKEKIETLAGNVKHEAGTY